MRFRNDASEYRAARDALLASEIALRCHMEAVAAQLRACRPEVKCPKTTYPTWLAKEAPRRATDTL